MVRKVLSRMLGDSIPRALTVFMLFAAIVRLLIGNKVITGATAAVRADVF